MQTELFGATPAAVDTTVGNKDLEQFFIPVWAAHLLMERAFPDLSDDDCVLDAGTGHGEFLSAVPQAVRAYGIDIDPALVEQAHENTGREIILGDFRTIPLPYKPTKIVSNPPFSLANDFLHRASLSLENNGQYMAIMVSSFLSFSSRLSRWLEIFSIEHDLIPRDLFPRISVPLSVYLFTKRSVRPLRGFMLFDEARIINGTHKNVKLALIKGCKRKSPWHAAVHAAMIALGGRASLRELYSYLQNKVPDSTRFWRDVIRRVLQEGSFVNVSRGVWALPS